MNGAELEKNFFARKEILDLLKKRVIDLKAFPCLGENSLAFLLGKKWVGFVIEGDHLPVVLVISHETFEGRKSAAGGIEHFFAERCRVERVGIDGKHRKSGLATRERRKEGGAIT